MPSLTPLASKALHLSAIRDIEREEERLREEIARKKSERDILMNILNSLKEAQGVKYGGVMQPGRR
jgi:predicted RNase H-like nuclease (RuvC/YqgF family)